MPRENRQVDPLEYVLSWHDMPCGVGVVGRTQDDCDGDWAQQLMMEATPDGVLCLYCRYPDYRGTEDTDVSAETERFIAPSWLQGPARFLWVALRVSQDESPQKGAPPLVPLPTVEEPLKGLLHTVPWPPDLETRRPYEVGSEGNDQVRLMIGIGPDGDAWVSVGEMYMEYRFRTSFGGGMSVPVRNALLIMAEAIRRHQEK